MFEAADVAEAVIVLKEIAVDLLISDISLIDGTVLAQSAKEHQPTTQLVWTSESRQNSVEYCHIALISGVQVAGRQIELAARSSVEVAD